MNFKDVIRLQTGEITESQVLIATEKAKQSSDRMSINGANQNFFSTGIRSVGYHY